MNVKRGKTDVVAFFAGVGAAMAKREAFVQNGGQIKYNHGVGEESLVSLVHTYKHMGSIFCPITPGPEVKSKARGL